MLFPIYWMFATALKPTSEVFRSPPSLIPMHPTLAAFATNFTARQPITVYIRNSAIVATGTVVLTVSIGAPAAYGLARKRIVGKRAFMAGLLAAQMFPSIILATPLYVIFSQVGLVDSYLALILADMTITLPFAIVVLRPFFLSLSRELEEAALVDGCDKFSAFRRIMLPLSLPGLLAVASFAFLASWGELLFAVVLTNQDAIRPVTVGIYKYIGEYSTDWSALMAAACISSLPVLAVFLLLQRQMVSGLTAGAVKS
jgi:multiple sugar transport system permease protein